MTETYAVKMSNITKKFGSFKAIDNLNLNVKKGTIHAILGENGAGKSTLMNILFGFYDLDDGMIEINDQKVVISNPNVAHQLGIGMVHQHFKLVKPFTVAQNVTLGNEIKRGLFVDKQKTDESVQAIIDKYNFGLEAKKQINNLSVGEQQRVEILKMLYQDANILIFDEPTGALTPQETEELLNIILQLKAAGKTVLIITHKLNEIKAVADECTIIRKGKSIKTVEVATTSSSQLAEYMVGRKVNFKVDKQEKEAKDVILTVSNISHIDERGVEKLSKTSFEVKSGEIFGIAGIDGNGQLEIVEAITGLTRVTSGSIMYDNGTKTIDIANMNARKIAEMKISHIPQDRHKHGVVLDYNIAQNASLKDYYKKSFAKSIILNNKKMVELGNKLIAEHDIRSPQGVTSIVRDMSGGNQQKLIIGRELEQQPRLLVASQPTRGVDVGAIENIHKKLIEVRDSDRSVILYSLELDEIIDLSDRILVMFDGRAMGIVDPKQVSKNDIGLLMAGKELGHEE